MPNKFFISTAIPYVNADPHIGFALELIQADALARWRRLHGQDVFFVTGTDENALKNAQAAAKAGEEVRSFVDRYAARFRALTGKLEISNDDFIRTTEARHIAGAHALWDACNVAGDIYKKRYQGLYCVGCEEFKRPKDLVDGVCPDHKVAPEEIEEENYFFKLSKYGDKILDLIDSGELKIKPASRSAELTEFLKEGLEDISISRSRDRARNWGIPVPGDDGQVMYVWFDALTNYINAIGYGTDDTYFRSWWDGAFRTHVVGKNITRFHAIYWPAILLSAGLLPPREVYVHGFVTLEGEKISKSLGNVIDPAEVANKYGIDPLRYYLLREIPSGGDGDFSYKNLELRYNSDLANGLGNLVQRVATLIEANLDASLVYRTSLVAGHPFLSDVLDDTAFEKAINEFRLHEAVGDIWRKIGLANVHVNEHKPWASAKENPEAFLKTMTLLAAAVHHIAWLLQPFMPETSQKIFKRLGSPTTKEISERHRFQVIKSEPLFPRI